MLIKQIEDDFITAYKAKDEVKTRVLRLIKTAIKNLQVELRRPPTSEEVLSILQKQSKQRKDSIEQFLLAKRDDLVQKEEEELAILKTYLPEAISGDALVSLVHKVIDELSIESQKEFGKIMGYITKEYKGRVDGKELSAVVQQILGSQAS